MQAHMRKMNGAPGGPGTPQQAYRQPPGPGPQPGGQQVPQQQQQGRVVSQRMQHPDQARLQQQQGGPGPQGQYIVRLTLSLSS